MKISVSMITMNEEQNIARALSSCSFADEIVVVDGGSSDRTLNILRANDKVLLIQRPWDNHFGKQRQASLDNCSGDWVIRLDADEAFSMVVEQNIRKLLSSTSDDIAGYKIRQCNLVGNEKYYSRIFDDFEGIPRIWRNTSVVKWERHIHEKLIGLSGTIKLCEVYVVHYGFLDRKRYWLKGEYYSKLPESGFDKAEQLYFREYDIQPRPPESRVAEYVPEYISESELSDQGEVVIISQCMNILKWNNFQQLSDKYNLTICMDEKTDIDYSQVDYHVINLSNNKAGSGELIGLEFELFGKDIICTEGIASTYTYQAILAKLKFGKKVMTVVMERDLLTNEETDDTRAIKGLAVRYVDLFVVFSELSRDALLLEGIPAEKIRIIPQIENESKIITGKFTELLENLFQSTFKGAISELSEYTGLAGKDILKRIRSVYSQQLREWSGAVGDILTRTKVTDFYSDTDSYLFDLVQYNYENTNYIQWTEDILNFCADLNKTQDKLEIIDFGGGIGSQLISLSALKGAELNYADIPGNTFEYAKWRFNKRRLDIKLIDATKEDFLGNRMFDIVIALDVVEHLVDPEESVEYLIRHIKPDGFFIAITSFVDNNGEAGWHLNVDKYTDEGFYTLIKSSGMEMMNEGMPRIFRKDRELSNLVEEVIEATRENRFEDARRYMESYLQLRPVDLNMLVKHAEICSRLGDRSAAQESLNKIRLFKPDMPEALAIADMINKETNEITSC
jgi:glycosyltransferase involved in cell wall biosynthesis/2-polyprenyl-3-methyl-5-hydroxy-6-metoxy-1,4-benzoquinol methylase